MIFRALKIFDANIDIIYYTPCHAASAIAITLPYADARAAAIAAYAMLMPVHDDDLLRAAYFTLVAGVMAITITLLLTIIILPLQRWRCHGAIIMPPRCVYYYEMSMPPLSIRDALHIIIFSKILLSFAP